MRESRIDHSAMPPQESWRDVAAAVLVHYGLRLASRRARRAMALHMAAELRSDAATRASRHLAVIEHGEVG
jgi:hypothetical protein